MSCTKEWILKTCKDNTKSLVDRLLEIRGIVNEDAKREFLHPLELILTHPNAFSDMPKATQRIAQAIDNNEKIFSICKDANDTVIINQDIYLSEGQHMFKLEAPKSIELKSFKILTNAK